MRVRCFGYGSLVNAKTLDPDADIVPCQLRGWVREWRVRGRTGIAGGACALTVRPEAGSAIQGVLIGHPIERLTDLDRRERRYDRVNGLTPDLQMAGPDLSPEPAFLYRAKTEHYGWGDDDHPILQSYLDCVLDGFHALWDEAGVRHFLATTDGWHVPVLADRDSPRYVRAVTLDPFVRELIDDLLAERSLRFLRG